MRGRPVKPRALKLISGTARKSRMNQQEPDPEYLNDLVAPAWLPPAAAAVWDEVVPDLRRARLLSMVDVSMLCTGCVAIAQYRLATAKLGDQLVIDKVSYDDAGVEVVTKAAQLNQWMVAQSMSFKQAMAVFQQFGMSPAARTRLAVQPQGDLFGEQKASSPYFS